MINFNVLLKCAMLAVAFYLLGSFIAADFNIHSWSHEGRYFTGCLWAVASGSLLLHPMLAGGGR